MSVRRKLMGRPGTISAAVRRLPDALRCEHAGSRLHSPSPLPICAACTTAAEDRWRWGKCASGRVQPPNSRTAEAGRVRFGQERGSGTVVKPTCSVTPTPHTRAPVFPVARACADPLRCPRPPRCASLRGAAVSAHPLTTHGHCIIITFLQPQSQPSIFSRSPPAAVDTPLGAPVLAASPSSALLNNRGLGRDVESAVCWRVRQREPRRRAQLHCLQFHSCAVPVRGAASATSAVSHVVALLC
jgi:hypothetical protein